MKATITVPAGFVPYLRKGLFGEWGYANEQLASLSLQFEGGAPEGSYFTLLHTFFTILTLLFEVGPRDNDAQGEVVINLGIGGTYVVRGLRHEHMALEDQLNEMPKTTRRAIRNTAVARVTEFGEFVKEVEAQVRRLNRQPVMPSTVNGTSRPPLRDRPSRVRQSRH